MAKTKKIKNVVVALKATRTLTLTLERVTGSITYFYGFIEGVRIIQSPGSSKVTWKGKIPAVQIRIKVRVMGIDNATFKFGIDLPGVADDQSLTLSLEGGYYETDITI